MGSDASARLLDPDAACFAGCLIGEIPQKGSQSDSSRLSLHFQLLANIIVEANRYRSAQGQFFPARNAKPNYKNVLQRNSSVKKIASFLVRPRKPNFVSLRGASPKRRRTWKLPCAAGHRLA